ncbi:MAG: molybdate ABC transporter substrate-binding protein [Rhodospirillales bacterium]|nr:molybdate ABC transporter substrate-binding protein [Rhodospirillales bacterium]
MSSPATRPARGALIRGIVLAALLLGGAGPARSAVLLFAAASTTTAMEEAMGAFAGRGLGAVRASFAGSSALAQQIANGAPADIFVSANRQWMDFLSREKAIVAASRVDLWGNRLALIVPVSAPPTPFVASAFPLARALGDGRLALGDPDHVPGGLYARRALENLGVWDGVAARLAPMADVRAALALVERGEAAAGVVYATDARVTRRVRVVGLLPADSHPPIVYPAAIVAGRDRPQVRRFFDFLTSAEAAAVFARRSFVAVARGR